MQSRGSALIRNAALASVSAWAMLASAAAGQVILDGTAGPGGALTGPNYVVDQTLGQTSASGTTVLHSFSQFDLATGQTVDFTGSNTLTAIIARITGGSPSSIDGTINSAVPGADFYFLNPNGFLFGANAFFNVAGSLYISTADRLNFTDQTFITMAASPDGALSSAPISSFGFLGAGTGNIVISGNSNYPDFADVSGNLSLIGSNVAVTDRVIMADRNIASQLRLAAVGDRIGTIGLTDRPDISGGDLTLTGFLNWGVAVNELADLYLSGGRIQLQNGSSSTNNNVSPLGLYLYSASSGRTNLIDISGGALTLRTAPGSLGGFGVLRGASSSVLTSAPGQVTIDLTGDLLLQRTTIDVSSWPGRAADVTIRAANATLDQSNINVMAGAYDAGIIRLDLTGDLTLTNTSRLTAHAPIASSVRNFQNRYDPATPGDAGAIIVNAGGRISLLNGSYMSVGSGMTTGDATNGRAGVIDLTAESLVMNGSDIDFVARAGGRAAGMLNVTVAGDIRLTGTASAINPAIGTSTFATLDGRSVTGEGGVLNLQAGGDIVLDGASVNVSTLGNLARGGRINVTGRSLTAQNSGFAFASGVFVDGPGGAMTLSVTDDAAWVGSPMGSGGITSTLDGDDIRLRSGGDLTFATSEIQARGGVIFDVGQRFTAERSLFTNPSGDIIIRAAHIELPALGSVDMTTAGFMSTGGQIHLQASLIDIGIDSLPSNSNDTVSLRAGAGGGIIVRAETLNIGPNATIQGVAGIQIPDRPPVVGESDSASIGLYANTLNIAPGAIISSVAPQGKAGGITLGAGLLNMAGGSIFTQGRTGGVIRVGVDDEMRLAGSINTTVTQASEGTDGDVYIGLTLTDPQLASDSCDADCQAYRPFSTSWTPGTHYGVPVIYDYAAADLRAENPVGRVIFGFGGSIAPELLALPAASGDEDSRPLAVTYLSALDDEPPSRCEIKTARGRGGSTLSAALRARELNLPGQWHAEVYGLTQAGSMEGECPFVAAGAGGAHLPVGGR